MTSQRKKIYFSPIYNFFTILDYYEFSNYLIYTSKHTSDLQVNQNSFLSEWDKSTISISPCWLIINEKAPKYIKSSQIYNIFLLSVWTLSPTEIEMKYKLKKDDGVTIIFDRFVYNNIDIRKTQYDLKDLDTIKKYFRSYKKIFRTNKRLLLALDSTYRACTTYSWKVSFIMYTTALEAILAYSRNRGITKRLACSYACFISDNNSVRDKLYREFYYLYNLRSEIIHGTYKRRKIKSNLKNLSRVAFLVRNIWQRILRDKTYLFEFEKDDNQRELFLKSFMGNYSPPKI
ncbi:MAG TPA: hypothetical protein VLH59_02225 [Ignavibacteriaceae bacterium]|nr:hypothetical protein [Ignavibacteriaceae bacterium]